MSLLGKFRCSICILIKLGFPAVLRLFIAAGKVCLKLIEMLFKINDTGVTQKLPFLAVLLKQRNLWKYQQKPARKCLFYETSPSGYFLYMQSILITPLQKLFEQPRVS